jgi:F-type H+-transporting ATPase subunit h
VRSLRSSVLVRTITTTPILRQTDPIQDLYLRELRNYKPSPPSPGEAEAKTKSWSSPRTPKVPETTAAPAEEIQTYASEQVSVTPRAGDEKFEHNFEDMFESWFDEPESEMRLREENPKWEKRQRRIFPPPPPRPEGYKGRSQRSRTGDD